MPLSHSTANSTIALSPCSASSRPNLPPTETTESGVPPMLASSAPVRGPDDLLEHQIVALQAERIAGELQRDVIEAAELELLQRILLALGQAAVELDAVQHARWSTP